MKLDSKDQTDDRADSSEIDSSIKQIKELRKSNTFRRRKEKQSQLFRFRIKGILTLISGFLWMLYVGSHFMVGNISPYINSYFPEATSSATQTLFPTILFVSIFSNFTGSQLVKRKLINPKLLVLIAGTIGIGGTFAASYTNSWTVFRIVFPVTYGIAVGLAYMVHLYLAWKYIPGKEGILTGIIFAGFGMGGSLFNYLSSILVNPETRNPVEIINPEDKPFPMEIAKNVPTMLRTLSLIWVCLMVGSLLTMQGYPSQECLDILKEELERKKKQFSK